MAERRFKNLAWSVADLSSQLYSEMRDGVAVAILMDIRDELQTLNRLLHCPSFAAMPQSLRTISRNTAKPRAKKVAK